VRILWISGEWLGGEMGVMAASIAAVWAAAGHEITYWPFGPDRAWHPPAVHTVVPPDPAPSGPVARLQTLGRMRRAFPLYDVVLVEEDLAVDFLAAEVLHGLKGPRPRSMLFCHRALGHYLAARGEHRSRRPRRLAETLYPRFDRLVTLVENAALDLERRFRVPRERLATLPWPTLPPEPQAAFRPARIVCLGYADGLKGLELLLQAVDGLRHEGVAATVELRGTGPRVPALTQLAGSLGVPLTVGPLTLEAVSSVAGSVFVAPQWLDGNGWQIAQAAAAGLPIVAVNAPDSATEMTGHGVLGKLVGLGRLDELRDALRPLLANADAWTGYHSGSLTLARRHQAEAVAPRWRDLLDGLLRP
jgi:glycosyltransferase involved in cell wall biosynthesis